jgi:capsular polysaccharide biosynthesis protein
MDIEDILYYVKRNRFSKKALKVLLTGCLFIVVIFIVLIIIAAILAFKYHTQIYDGFMRIINFIFGDSPDNMIRGFFKQIADNFLKNLFSGE